MANIAVGFVSYHDLDRRGTFLYASPSSADLLGFTPAELKGNSPFEMLFHPEDIQVAHGLHEVQVKEDMMATFTKMRMRRKDGHYVACEIITNACYDCIICITKAISCEREGRVRFGPERSEDAPEFSKSQRITSVRDELKKYVDQHFDWSLRSMSMEPRFSLLLDRFSLLLPVCYASRAAETILGLKSSFMVGFPFFSFLVGKGDARHVRRELNHVRSQDSAAHLFFTFYSPRYLAGYVRLEAIMTSSMDAIVCVARVVPEKEYLDLLIMTRGKRASPAIRLANPSSTSDSFASSSSKSWRQSGENTKKSLADESIITNNRQDVGGEDASSSLLSSSAAAATAASVATFSTLANSGETKFQEAGAAAGSAAEASAEPCVSTSEDSDDSGSDEEDDDDEEDQENEKAEESEREQDTGDRYQCPTEMRESLVDSLSKARDCTASYSAPPHDHQCALVGKEGTIIIGHNNVSKDDDARDRTNRSCNDGYVDSNNRSSNTSIAHIPTISREPSQYNGTVFEAVKGEDAGKADKKRMRNKSRSEDVEQLRLSKRQQEAASVLGVSVFYRRQEEMDLVASRAADDSLQHADMHST